MGFKLILTVVWPRQYIMKIAFALLTSRTLLSKRLLVPSMSISSVHPILIWQYLSFKMRGWGDKKTTIPWDEVCCGPRNKQRNYRKYLSFKMSDGWETTFYNTMSIPWGEVCCGPRNHTWYLSRTPRIYLCKFFLAGVNFHRFNAKNWQFTVYFAVITQKIGNFLCILS